jgi:hypothetical protein
MTNVTEDICPRSFIGQRKAKRERIAAVAAANRGDSGRIDWLVNGRSKAVRCLY